MKHQPKEGDLSPWGPIQSVSEKAEGIIFASTASHGGYWLSPERMTQVPEALRRAHEEHSRRFHTPVYWWEEDLEAALVVLAFPDLWDDFSIYACWSAFCSWHRRVPWNGQQRDRVEARAKTWEREHATAWLKGSASTHGENGWTVWFSQVGTGDRAKRIMEDYPDSPFYDELPGEPAAVTRTAGRAS